jgi:hypothetical protein
MKVSPPSSSHDGDDDETKEYEAMPSVINNSNNGAVTPLHPGQCDMVLESMDGCVGCLDGVGEQHTFEEGLRERSIRQREIADRHGLSEAEATLIRLQMMDDTTGLQSAVEDTLTNLTTSPLVLCGGASLPQEEDVVMFSDVLCEGIVSPIDTTMPTSLPGDALVESRQGKSSRSLVDLAEKAETIHEHAATVDARVQECAICNDSSCTDDHFTDNGDLSSRSMASAALQQRKPTFLRLPCCESDESPDNFKVCTACMIVLTIATKDGFSRVGRCPRCRSWISVNTLHSTSAVMDVRMLKTSGKCESCLQIKTPLISGNPDMCDACFLGKEVPLIYECEECHRSQTIESTMYRSQPTAASVGNEMWPCHTCQKSTHWTIRCEQLSLIPAGDIPEEWGDEFLELARIRVQKTRQGIAKLDLLGRDAQGNKARDDGCMMM